MTDADRRNGDRRKAPAYQWYPGDALRDISLRSCSLAARGLWREMLDWMHDATPYGHLIVNGKAVSPETLATMVGAPPKQVVGLLAELEGAGVYSKTADGTIYSRRMVRDEATRQSRAAGGAKSLQNPNVPRPKDTSKDILKGHPQGSPEGRDGRPSPAVASASASASAKSKASDTSYPGDKPPSVESNPMKILGPLIREHLYRDTKPPEGWNPRRCADICTQLLKRHSVDDLAEAIRIIPLIRARKVACDDSLQRWFAKQPHLTMRALNDQWGSGSVMDQLLHIAMKADTRPVARDVLGAA